MDNKVSVKELNEILQNKLLSKSITYSEVDIVFIAGLFLLYKKKKQKLPPLSFKLDEKNGRHEIHKSYFKQIKELYNVNYNDIIETIPNTEPSNTYKPDSYSSSFAPPLYITRDTMVYFFGNERGNEKIEILKNKYIKKLEDQEKNKEEQIYFKQPNNIIKELKESSPIHTFIFSVAYNKIQPFVKSKEKGFNSPSYAIKQIWQFTQAYVRGLYELAKNIVEHSGQGINDGQGMITIRAYDGTDNNKVLETFVFDYGDKGILIKLKEYTIKLEQHYSQEIAIKEVTTREKGWLNTILHSYKEDLKKLDSNYKLSNFIITPKIEDQELQQQVLRDIAHFGLRKFYQLIKKYNGEMYLASNGNYFDKDDNESIAKNKTIDFTGTSYYFQIPFDTEKFKETEITTSSLSNLTTTFGSTTALQKLHKIQHIVISIDNSDNIEQCIEMEKKKYSEHEIWQDVILDFKIKLQVKEKNDVPKLYKYFENLKDINNISVRYLAIDLENIINDVSILLRFLSHLTVKYEYPIIIYNLNNDLYRDMVSDIENFYNERYAQNKKTSFYWHEDRAILLFTKTKEQNFYFADILYGKDENDFLLANKIINSTFPNSKTILLEKERKIAQKYSDRFSRNKNLMKFFNDKLLLPFDTILANKTPLFISNLKTLLKNELPENDVFRYSNLNSYIEKCGGYHISQTHFKIGGKIHSEDFYYAKGLFQNSFYTTRLAMHLANELANEIISKQIKNLTLIGYEMYSELLLSLISKFLEERFGESAKITINHFIAQDVDGKLQFKPKGNYEDYVKVTYKKENCQAIIIVPIASTGSTAKKILETLKDSIISYATNEKLKKNKDSTKDIALAEAKKDAKLINLFDFFYNILWAKPIGTPNFGLVVESIKLVDKKKEITQKSIIELPAVWHTLDKCKLCYGNDDQGNQVNTLSLFETDKSSLTPAIVFDYPVGKKQVGVRDISYVDFDLVDFSDSLKYKNTYRNNEFLLYSTDTEKLIKKNKGNIINWLKSIKKTLDKEHYVKYFQGKLNQDKIITLEQRTNYFKNYVIDPKPINYEEVCFEKFVKLFRENNNLRTAFEKWLNQLDNETGLVKTSDKIVIISPCHETNSGFINMVNQYVFNSSATIIHYQANVDFAENFRKLNSRHLSESNTKIFYVDDSLISGKNFFNLFDLVRGTKEISKFNGTIILSDKSTVFTHNRIVRWSGFMFSFVSYNQPPSISLSEQRPLEYERQRYKSISKLALHDAVIKTFKQKVDKLNPENSTNKYATKRHLRLFEATHKIYDYFSKNDTVDFEIESVKFVNFKDNTNKIENNNAKIKVLSQYPFILYKPLREKTFEWHKKLLEQLLLKINELDTNLAINEQEYLTVFTSFKLLMRRAVFLGNYQIIEIDFLNSILNLFKKIDQYYIQQETEGHLIFNNKLALDIEKNLSDFPIFLLSNYLEIIQKNGWIAVKLIKNIKQLEKDFLNGASISQQFYRMLQIESAVVIDDYVKMIEKEHHFKWRDMCKHTLETKHRDTNKMLNSDFITNGLYINDFFKTNWGKINYRINKYEIAKAFVKEFCNDEKIKIEPIVNFLWIKQMIFNDTIDKNPYFPKKINYQTKIDAILEKMKGLFTCTNIKSFFIVTDNEQTPYVLYDKDYVLQNFEGEYHSNVAIIDGIRLFRNKEQLVTNGVENSNLYKFDELYFSEIFKFLYGMPDVQNLAVETIKEYEKKDEIWYDCYNNKNRPKIDFLTKCKYLLLIRLSNLGDNREFITSGMLGFYGENTFCNKSESILPKQLLMLLRRDMNEFIVKHHKNDQFAKLREEELRNRYAYLAGHGRKMLQDLIENSDCKELFTDIVGTINRLQYVFSSEIHKEKRVNILKEGFPYEENGNISNIIEKMAAKIFETRIIENKVDLKNSIQIHENSKMILNNFHFNYKILKFIFFELLVNAKKNRYHFIDDDTEKNEVSISIFQETNKLIIEIAGTGARFDEEMKNKINNQTTHIKDKNKYEISSGIELMRNVIGLINSENTVCILDSEKITETKFINKVKISLCEI